MKSIEMGYSEVDITPDFAVQLVGFHRSDNTSRGIRDALSAQVSVWKYENEVCSLIAMDHIGFSREHANELRDKVGQILGSSREKVMICFSHTHSAPNEEIEETFRLNVSSKVCDCAAKALQNLHPVSIGWGNANAKIGFNRRKESTAIDDRIGILKVTDTDCNELRLILLRVTAHANVLKKDNYMISSDYFGAVRNRLKEKYHCPVMVTQGAAGNIAPKYVCTDLDLPDTDDESVVRSASALEKMAEEIECQIQKVFDKIICSPIQKVDMYSKHIEFSSEVPNYDKALKLAEEAYQNTGINGEEWLAEIRNLLQKQEHEQTDSTEVQFFVLDEGVICGVANEIMCEFALNVWERSGNEYCYFGGYTNGCTGYFPTEEEYDRGGYEVYWSMLIYYKYYGRVFPLKRESATRLVEFVAENLIMPNR